MSYLDRVKNHLFPHSEEKSNIQTALREWAYHGALYDLKVPCESCQLCGHSNIRYQFEIVNQLNKRSLLVGSECITRFQIDVIVDGETIHGAFATRKLHADKRKLVTDPKKNRLVASLIEIANRDSGFDLDNYLHFVLERGAFSPDDLVALFRKFDQNRIDYDASMFKVSTRSREEKEQLREMEEWDIGPIWDCLTPAQQRYREDHKE